MVLLYFVIISQILGIISTFCFFGDAFFFTEGFNPKLLDVMVGTNGYPRYTSLTILFIFQMLFIVLAIFNIFLAIRMKKDKFKMKIGFYIYIGTIVFMLVPFMLGITILGTTKIKATYPDAHMGVGTILYLMAMFASMVTLGVAVFDYFYIAKLKRKRNAIPISSLQGANKRIISKQGIDQTKKIELLQKYKQMYDLELISKEEYEQKKKELLD